MAVAELGQDGSDWSDITGDGEERIIRVACQIDDCTPLSAKIVKDATLKVISARPTECAQHKDRVTADLLAFIKGEKSASAAA